jgi:hypothetical protein
LIEQSLQVEQVGERLREARKCERFPFHLGGQIANGDDEQDGRPVGRIEADGPTQGEAADIAGSDRCSGDRMGDHETAQGEEDRDAEMAGREKHVGP